ncbi:TonB-dependent receptor [Ideonella sp.]|uniref:TonB-dependent receptor n=1 Tax=Ideonella sp. TaxID=1929293 RepID=UPI002B4976E2|nr:TonB-dependent receptor [Ideonella sp.]HJV72083.1 TonB-dependent receptor [Ideonella sp.]
MLAAFAPATLAQDLAAAAADATAPQRVEIIGTTPVPGAGVAKDFIPANVQTADDERLRQLQSLNLPDFLSSQLPSVNVNEVQGNPYQMDLNYRGFSASPLLGTPQGLSVFQDGVRINEPFGDVVNWDLIPKAALARLTLLPGSNPLFGLNTLGGALSLETKRGDTHPGTEAELQAGSFGRVSAQLSHGRSLGDHGHLFLAVETFDEDGWRDYSPSRVRQLFAKTGQHTSAVDWDVSLTHGDNRLIGNGPLPESMLAADRSQVYTRPDITDNEMTMLTFNGRVRPSAALEISGTAYSRHARAATLNGDLNDAYDPPEVTAVAVEHRTHTRQQGEGLALQASYGIDAHRLAAGVTLDRARSRFSQTTAEGDLDATLLVLPTGEAVVDAMIGGHSRSGGLYATGLFELDPTLHLSVSGRYNDTRVQTVDLGRATLGLDTQLDANARYRKFNPALGLTWQASSGVTAYGGFSQGSRAPSPIELGCSDPEHACVLPNALQSDPPLKQVVSRTLEGGLRGHWDNSPIGELRWNASAYRTINQDDLLFISNGLAAGYFTNFGRTLRQGLELGLSQRRAAVDWAVSYSYLRATFDSSACLFAEANSTAETSAACTGQGEIEVRPGNHLPGLPAHSLKMSLDARFGEAWTAGAQLQAYSSQFARGNENNAHRPDGEAFNGSGRVGGYALLNLTASWKPAPAWELFARLTNVFDRRYASSGLLGENAFDAQGRLLAPDARPTAQFVGPGAPRALWLGLRWSLDGA